MLKIEFPKSQLHPKAWGSEEWIKNFDKYCLKILNFNKGSRFSYHYHDLKTETWLIDSGKIILETKDLETSKDYEFVLEAGAIIHVPRLAPHRITALEETRIIEVSTQHFENDSLKIGPGDSQK